MQTKNNITFFNRQSAKEAIKVVARHYNQMIVKRDNEIQMLMMELATLNHPSYRHLRRNGHYDAT